MEVDKTWQEITIEKLRYKISYLQQKQWDLGYSMLRANMITRLNLAISNLRSQLKGY